MTLLLPTNGSPLKASNDILAPDNPLIDYSTGIVSSTKKDGNRGLCVSGSLFTSSMKTPRNPLIHEWLAPLAEYAADHDMVFDYEIYDTAGTHHGAISGLINSDGYPVPDSYRAYIFDASPRTEWENQCRDLAYAERIVMYENALKDMNNGRDATDLLPAYRRFVALAQRPVPDAACARALFLRDLEDGNEGSMLRSLYIESRQGRLLGGWYKHGRATNAQRIMWKQKLYVTCDGVVTGVYQRRRMKAIWPRELDAKGHLIRPHTQDAYEPDNKVGSLLVSTVTETGECIETELMFGKGGFDHLWLEKAWDDYCRDPHTLVGRVVEFRHMPHGAKEGGRRRMGQLLRFRDDLTPADIGLPQCSKENV